MKTPEYLTVNQYKDAIHLEAPYNGFGTQPKISVWNKDHVYNVVQRPDKEGDKAPETFRDEMLAIAEKVKTSYIAFDDMVSALRAVVGKTGRCENDALNPCLSGWERGDEIRHWGGGEACPTCKCRAALLNADVKLTAPAAKVRA